MATSDMNDWHPFLSTLDYPIKKDILKARAIEYGLDEDEVERALEDVPDEEFNSPNNVTEALAKLTWPGA